jgi:AcrR family transcriptional regulator
MSSEARRSGRRPGESSARADILEAARTSFAEHGYDRATIRDIAGRAGVDPALVMHYFGSKEGLFGEALELPIRPGEVFARGLAAGPGQLGATIIRTFLESWEPPENRVRLVAMLRSALTNDTAMVMMRDLLGREVFGPITEALGVPDAQLRATLVGSQLIGISIMRYVGRIEPIASAPVDELVAAIGPTLERYLTADLGAGPPAAAPRVDATTKTDSRDGEATGDPGQM